MNDSYWRQKLEISHSYIADCYVTWLASLLFSSQSRLKLHSSPARGSAVAETTEHGDAQSEDIVIPEYVERSPTDILKVSWVYLWMGLWDLESILEVELWELNTVCCQCTIFFFKLISICSRTLEWAAMKGGCISAKVRSRVHLALAFCQINAKWCQQ